MNGRALVRNRQAAQIGIRTKPQALVFKGDIRVPTRAVVCGDCGLLRQFVDREALQKLRQAKQWERV